MAEEIEEAITTLQKVVSPVILTIGTVGNILTFIVLVRPRARQYSTAIYLIALTVVDFIALYTGLLRIFVVGAFDVDIRRVSEASCKLHIFFVYFSTHCSSWLVCAVTIERVISVWFPHRIKTGCHPKSALLSVITISLIVMSVDSHFLYGFTIQVDFDNRTNCMPQSHGYIEFIDKAWPWIDMTLLFLIPFAVIVAGNVLIIVRVKFSQRLRRRSCPNVGSRRTSGEPLFFLTAMLITLNVVFMLCVMPIVIYIIGQYTWWPARDYSTYSDYELAINRLLWVIVNLLNYVNYAVNFLLYILCGSKFREELMLVLCRCRRSKQIRNNNSHLRLGSKCSFSTSVHLSDIIQGENGATNHAYS